MIDELLEYSDRTLLGFLDPQIREYGGRVDLDENHCILFAVPGGDTGANGIAVYLLGTAPFAHQSGETEDDQWRLYYVDRANVGAAMDWLAERQAWIAGEILPVSGAHKALIAELGNSTMPHRIAQKLADLHASSALSAGAIRDPALVRTLLDRLHVQEPLFFSAFLKLLSAHLIDMKVLLDQIISEDIRLENDIVRSGLSRDPFLQSRQDAATEIRQFLIRFHIISAMDQQQSLIDNPYAAYVEIARTGEEITAMIDGNTVTLKRDSFLAAIRSIRRNLYKGGDFSTFSTQVPWVTEEIAYPFRFIKQKLAMHRDVSPLDGIYMMQRGVEG